MSFFKNNALPSYWFIVVFGIKVIVSILITSIYTNYYTDRSTADIFRYFDDSKVIFDALKTHPLDYLKMVFGLDFNTSYYTENYYTNMSHWSRPYFDGLFSDTHIIIRFNAFLRLFSFGHFQVHNIFMNFVSLAGLTLIFKAFKPFLKNKEKVLFYVLFIVPSILFWGSGLLKESIIFLGLGLILFNLFKLSNRFKLIHLLFIFLGVFLIIYTKFYLLFPLLIAILGYLTNHYLKIKKTILGYIISVGLFLLVVNIAPQIHPLLNVVKHVATKQQDFSKFIAVVETNSGFEIAQLSDGFSILINIPNALINTTIRPYLWECKSLFVWLSALENIAIIICIIIVLFFRKKMSAAQQNIFYFNLLFVFYLFTLIGLTTPVFGAIIRYKIPGLILLLISLLLLIDLEKIKSKHLFLKKIL